MKKRPLWRRIARVVTRVFGAVIVLAIVVLIFIHTSWGKSFIRGRVEAKLNDKLDGKVSVGSLDYTFLFGSITLGDVDIEDASGHKAVHVGTLHASIDRGSVIAGAPIVDELAIEGVRVELVQNADGTTNLTGLAKPSDSKPLDHIAIAKLVVGGAATIHKPDGTTVTIDDLAITGKVDAKPATQEAKVIIDKVTAAVTLAPPAQPEKKLALAIENLSLDKVGDKIDADIKTITAGPLRIDGLSAHGNVVNGKPTGPQAVTIASGKIDKQQLAAFLGHAVLLDDVTFDAKIAGPAESLSIHGGVKTRQTSLMLDGTADVSKPDRPSYAIVLVGKGKSIDVVADATVPPVETDIRIEINGAGIAPETADVDAKVVVGPTKIRDILVDSLVVTGSAHHNTFHLDDLTAKGLGFEVKATGELQANHDMTAHVSVGGSPQEAIRVLGAAGVAIPRKVPVLRRIDIAIAAEGNIDRDVTVTIEPTHLGIAGGEIAFSGKTQLDLRPEAKRDNKTLVSAATTIDLRHLDLVALAQLADKPARVKGILSGHLELTRTATDQHAKYAMSIALPDPRFDVTVGGEATATDANLTATVARATLKVAALTAHVSLDPQGVRLDGPWHLVLDAPSHSLAELVALAPPDVQDQLKAKLPDGIPDGNVAIHADLAGTPAAPSGAIDVSASAAALPALGTQKATVHAKLAQNGHGMTVTTTGELALDSQPPVAIAATVSVPPLFHGKQIDPHALDAATIEAHIALPDRALATLAPVRAKLAELGGSVDGSVDVTGTAKAPQLVANLRWHGYTTADGKPAETTLVAHGTPEHSVIDFHHGPIAITADVTQTGEHVVITGKAHSDPTSVLALVPASILAPGKLPSEVEPGRLELDLEGSVVIDHGELVEHHVHGGLDVKGASVAIPHTTRKWHDIGLAVTATDDRVRLESLTVHESDVEDKDRTITITGELAKDRAQLALASHDWLLSGGTLFGDHDAPRAAADFDIGVEADLSKDIPQIDATVRHLELRSPDRQERAHQPEQISVSGDVIFLDGTKVAGKLPAIAPELPEAPKKRPHLDVKVHIPKSIHIVQTPFDLTARGELTVTVRDEGVATRGVLAMDGGQLWLFGRYHDLANGKVSFTDEHPHGWMELVFERRIPDVSARDLANQAGPGRISFEGPPTKPKVTLSGATSGGLLETMSMLNAGRPLNVTAPDLPAGNTVQVPRGDQIFVLTFMATNLPHMLFLDRMSAWADPYAPKGGYGQIRDVEAERDLKGGAMRVRAVVRPPEPGRSEGELQLDRVFVHTDRSEAGVGLRAGDRVGGGLGLFFEWSGN